MTATTKQKKNGWKKIRKSFKNLTGISILSIIFQRKYRNSSVPQGYIISNTIIENISTIQ
jgi:hypothetical protein